MEFLKKYFPLSFKEHKSVTDLGIGILVYLVAGLIAGVLIWLGTAIAGWLGFIGSIIGFAFGIVGAVVDLYVLVGIIIAILVYTKVIKE